MGIHFYADDDVAATVTGWDPDEEPERFASGLGHNLLELFSRFDRLGLPVTIGTRIPKDAQMVVYYQYAWARLGELRLALRAAPFRTAVIRSDAPLWWWNLLPADLVVVPNEHPVWNARLGAVATHLPALPQRGMLRRDPGRAGIRVVAFKGNPESVPADLRRPDFLAELEDRGVSLVLDTPRCTNGDDQAWHDFRDVDVVLCLRGAAPDDPLTNKPATRLVNAWCAGAIPLVAPEPAYLELVRDGVDGFVVDGPQEVLRVLDLLADDEERTAAVLLAARNRGREYDTSVVLDRWVTALEGSAGQRRGRAATVGRRALVVRGFTSWAASGAVRRVLAGRPGS